LINPSFMACPVTSSELLLGVRDAMVYIYIYIYILGKPFGCCCRMYLNWQNSCSVAWIMWRDFLGTSNLQKQKGLSAMARSLLKTISPVSRASWLEWVGCGAKYTCGHPLTFAWRRNKYMSTHVWLLFTRANTQEHSAVTTKLHWLPADYWCTADALARLCSGKIEGLLSLVGKPSEI
jgi:hypothetical protein